MEGNLRDIVLSVFAGGAMMLLFASTIAFVCCLAWGLARARDWVERHRGGEEG